MSTLVLILTAAMTVPASGPEMVSGEIEDRLDLSGEWEVTWMSAFDKTGKGKVEDGKLRACIAGSGPMNGGHFAFLSRTDFTDEGDGKLRVNWASGSACGIYQYRGDRLLICWRLPDKGRPAYFHAGEDQELFILHRVKPRK